ncbi:hypothetical protein TcWFU_009492 [Taenia crassiceps]|uniref:Uncharacterized protein n=1 Tax=Taenia crassiceps TaxID=6207 RepID=A0ABR4QU94_9CEST
MVLLSSQHYGCLRPDLHQTRGWPHGLSTNYFADPDSVRPQSLHKLVAMPSWHKHVGTDIPIRPLRMHNLEEKRFSRAQLYMPSTSVYSNNSAIAEWSDRMKSTKTKQFRQLQ